MNCIVTIPIKLLRCFTDDSIVSVNNLVNDILAKASLHHSDIQCLSLRLLFSNYISISMFAGLEPHLHANEFIVCVQTPGDAEYEQGSDCTDRIRLQGIFAA